MSNDNQLNELFDSILMGVIETNMEKILLENAERSGDVVSIRLMKTLPLIAKRHKIRTTELFAILMELSAALKMED